MDLSVFTVPAVPAYLRELRAGGRSLATVRLRYYQLRHFRMHVAKPLDRVTRSDVVEYLSGPGHLRAETRASRRYALTSFYGWAVESGYMAADPTKGIRPVQRPQGVPRPCPDAVVVEAMRTSDAIDRAAIVLARFAGLRAGEVARARGSDADTGQLHVRGKGGRERYVPLHPEVEAVLRAAGRGYVFPADTKRGHWTPGNITVRVSRALGPWTCHSLRHAFATEVYRQSGNDLRLTQDLLGHASPTTTARYVLVDADRKHAVVSGLHLAA